MLMKCYWKDTCKSGFFEGMTALRQSEVEFPTLEAALEKYQVVRAPDGALYAIIDGAIAQIDDAKGIEIMEIIPWEARCGSFW